MMTRQERFDWILKHKPVDRVGLLEVYSKEVALKRSAEGHFEKPEMISNHFGLDVPRAL